MTETLRPQNVMHCAETVRGGIATYLNELVPLQVQDAGPGSVCLLIPASQAGDMGPAGACMFPFPDGGGRLLKTFRLVLALRRLLRTVRPEVVHAHSSFAGLGVRLYLALIRWPGRVVYCPHGWAFDQTLPPWARRGIAWIERGLARLCDAIVCISEHERRQAEAMGIAPARLAVIPNGMSDLPSPCPGPWPPWPDGLLRVLFVGRFDRQKGVDLFFKAMEALQGKACAFAVGGQVRQDTLAVPAPANVALTGWLDPVQLRPYFESAQVLVVPSRWEGFGLVALEAMRCALPVVATQVGGLSEIVVDGCTGFLVPAGDWQAIADVLGKADPEKLRELGRAGRDRFLQRFPIRKVAQSLRILYGFTDPPRQ
jgi:glycosyltransferase involved in cell wall biosynthesis